MKTRLAHLLALPLLLAACRAEPAALTPSGFEAPLPNQVEAHTEIAGQPHQHLDPAQATVEMQVVIVPSELVVGPNRFAVGLLQPDGRMILDAQVHFHYYDLSNPNGPRLESESDAARVQTPDGATVIFTHERSFERAGRWGVEIQARFPDGTAAIQRVQFEVLSDSSALLPGEKAPPVDTLTFAGVNDEPDRLTSAHPPNPAFYQVSLAESLKSGRPTVLLFSTPAFCQTRLCGPVYEILSEVEKKHGASASFIHVEVYTGLPDPTVNNWQVAPAMSAFGLQTEPWLYLIDGEGTVHYRVEGLFSAAEVERQLTNLLAR
jgi:hypothetical protein